METTSTGKDDRSPQTVVVTGTSAERNIHVDIGDRIHVELGANETTSYRWVLGPETTGIWASTYQTKRTADPRLVGGGGTRIFDLDADQAGTFILHAQHRSPWDPDQPVIDEIRVLVHVGE